MKQLLKFLYNWVIFIFAIIVVLLYIILNSEISTQQELNRSVVTNTLFTIINLFAAFYIARKVSLWGWQSNTTDNQKKIAKTAIRHNRGSLASILKLIKITRNKLDKVEDELTKQYIVEIKNHLEMIYNGLKNSEADFNEIVGEELKEQNILEVEISDLYNEIETKSNKLNEISSFANDKDEEIADLKEQLRQKENELSTKISRLPFGAISTGTGVSGTLRIGEDVHIFDDDQIKPLMTIGKKKDVE